MIEEHKTYYKGMRHCEHLSSNVIVEQLKGSETMIVRCRYNHLDNTCYVNFDPNNWHDRRYFEPITCPPSVEKLVKKVDD